MKSIIIATSVLLPAAGLAQVLEPVPINPDKGVTKTSSLFLQVSNFSWDTGGVKGQTGGLIGGDFAVSKRTGLGFWIASDRQTASDGSSGTFLWTEIHVNTMFSQSKTGSFGVTTGWLSSKIDAQGFSDTVQWYELGLVGSVAIGGKNGDAGPFRLGATWGYLAGQASTSGNFQTSNGSSYGFSAEYLFSEGFGLSAATWVMSMDTGAKITRTTFGVSFHF